MKKILTLLAACLVLQMQAQELRLLVGTYTEGTSAEGVYLYSFDAKTAETALLSVAPSGNPSFVIATPDGSRAYSVNEFNDGRQAVSAYALGEDRITLLNTVPIPKSQIDGEDPCNILWTGESVITSNYTGGSVTAFSLEKDGRIGTMTQYYYTGKEYTYKLTGTAATGPAAHMHCAVLSPDGKYIFVTNLGMDCIHRFDLGEGVHPIGKSETAWKSLFHYGPRHMVFSADGRFAYLLCELGDRLIVFSYDNGTLTPIQNIAAYKGRGHGSADIHLSPDGRFLYTSHRLKEDGIAVFEVNQENGKVKKTGYHKTGTHPRNFAISPDGRFLLCACRDSNRIEIYSINEGTGTLTQMDKSIEVGAPVCVQFLP